MRMENSGYLLFENTHTENEFHGNTRTAYHSPLFGGWSHSPVHGDGGSTGCHDDRTLQHVEEGWQMEVIAEHQRPHDCVCDLCSI